MNWKLDLSKKGFEKIFKPYQKAVIDVLLDAHEHLGTGLIWQAVRDEGIEISRASVIFFLDFLVKDGLCTTNDTTGKGGHFNLYRLISDDWEGVNYHLTVRIIEALGEALNYDMTNAIQSVI